MANSAIIGKAKNRIVRELIKDDMIVQAIHGEQVDSTMPEQLIGSYIFDYHQNPNTLNEVGTFITIQVHIPRILDSGKTYVKPTVEIWIISHEKHLSVNNIPKVVSNRNDYLSELIDKKLNGASGFGIGTLALTLNIEGSYQHDYLFRKMVFEGTDLNNSMCDEE